MKKIFAVLLGLTLTTGAWASGQLSIGANYDGWNTNYSGSVQDNGFEVFTPVSLGFQIDPQLSVYAGSEFETAGYTGPTSSSTFSTVDLTNISDTTLGGKYIFNTISLKSVAEVAFNIPTGDTSWETKAQISEPPVQFIDSRYAGRGFGFSAFYGLSLPDGRGEYSVGAGYLYAGAFNPNYGTTTNLKLGDAVFVAVNRVTPFQNEENEIMRFSVYQSFPTYENGTNTFQLGTNLNASYNWSNPKALSFEAGTQFYLPSSYNGTTESHNSNGPRIYANGTYAFGDFALTARVKYIFQNDYPLNDPSVISLATGNDGGGGLQLGIEPSLRLGIDDVSSLKISASVDQIYANNVGVDANNNPTTVNYLFWAFHSEYIWKL